jgi:hypothetical protein
VRFLACAVVLAACTKAPSPPAPAPGLANVGLANVAAPAPAIAALELADAVALAGHGILARTAAGNLVRFDTALLPVREAAAKVVAIAAGDRHFYAALADGSVAEVDPTTLQLRTIATLAGEPLWISAQGSELLGFVRSSDRKRLSLEVFRDGTRTKTIAIPDDRSAAMSIGTPSVWLRDGNHVWFGIDAGEWGGAVGKIDLAIGTVTPIKHREPVFGFAAAGGRIWAYGGMIHMGHTAGYIVELTSGTPKSIWHRENDYTKKATTKPYPLPVVRMISDGTGFLVLVWNELFAVDAAFTTWTPRAALRAREHPGRPDSVGNYPATRALVRAGDRLVFATARDGLFVLRGSTIEPAR